MMVLSQKWWFQWRCRLALPLKDLSQEPGNKEVVEVVIDSTAE